VYAGKQIGSISMTKPCRRAIRTEREACALLAEQAGRADIAQAIRTRTAAIGRPAMPYTGKMDSDTECHFDISLTSPMRWLSKVMSVHDCSDPETQETTLMTTPSPAAVRMRRLRARRRNGWTKVIGVEVSAMDALALRHAGYLRQGETAMDDLPLAIKRLVASIR